MTRSRRLAAAVAIAAGCGAPEDPSWRGEVKPILQANCAGCHGQSPRGGAPSGFRLDVYDGRVTDGGQLRYGASSMAYFVHLRTHAEQMPPVAPLTGRQIEILERWYQGGAPRGEPDAGNAAPTAALLAVPGALDDAGFLELEIEIGDADFDIVTGALRAVPAAGDDIPVTSELYSGRQRVRWDARSAPAGSYQLVATLDDEHRSVEVPLADYELDYAGEPAPSIAIRSPDPDALLDADEPVEVTVELGPEAAGPFALSVFAVRGAETIEVASRPGVGPGETTIAIETSALETGGNWSLRAVAAGGVVERSASVGPLVVARGESRVEFLGDMFEVFNRNCRSCHGDPDDPQRIENDAEFNLFIHGETRSRAGLIYRRVVQEQTMPPRSIGILYGDAISAEDRQMFAEWLLAGAECPQCTDGAAGARGTRDP